MGEAGTDAADYGSAGSGAAHAAASTAGGGPFAGALSGLAAAMSEACDGTGDALERASQTLIGNAESYRAEEQMVSRRLSGVEF
jgi:hypothetical protein